MITFEEFAQQAPRIAEVFRRRHQATGNLCLLGTTRSDGWPRVSPMEPRITGEHLCLVGMPGTTKFKDLQRDPRFCLHTATVDPQLGDGDAKLFGRVVDRHEDEDLQRRFVEEMYEESGYDFRDERFDPFFVADITGASALRLADDKLLITTWKPGADEVERVLDE